MGRAKQLLGQITGQDRRPELDAFARQLLDDEVYNDELGASEWPVEKHKLSDEDWGEERIQCGRCTNSARLIAQKFGGKVYGYGIEENPEALLGQDTYGHDFAVIGGYIVDYWAAHFTGDSPQAVVALGTEEARRLYGDPKKWTLMYDYSAAQESGAQRARAIVEQMIRANYRVLVEGYAKQTVRKLAYPYHDQGNVNGFIGYLEHTLIPDLQASGTDAMAEEFETLVTLLKYPPPAEEPTYSTGRVEWSHRMSEAQNWIAWLQSTLIPDLREDGYEATADDLETGIWFLHALGYWCEPVEGSYDQWKERRPVPESRAKDFLRKVGTGITTQTVYDSLLKLGWQKIESADRMSGVPDRFLVYKAPYMSGHYDRQMNWLRVSDVLNRSRNTKVPLDSEHLAELRALTDHLEAGHSEQALTMVREMVAIAGEP
jgi:hypothetical protein